MPLNDLTFRQKQQPPSLGFQVSKYMLNTTWTSGPPALNSSGETACSLPGVIFLSKGEWPLLIPGCEPAKSPLKRQKEKDRQ